MDPFDEASRCLRTRVDQARQLGLHARSRTQFTFFDMLLLRPADMQVLERLAAGLDQRRDEFIDRFTGEAAESIHRTFLHRQ